MSESRYYFDWAATAIPERIAEDAPFGNPSSPHREGKEAREALESARSRCAAVLGVPADTVYFTSGGTESNCIPIFSFAARQSAGRLLCSAGEHKSVSENLLCLERIGKQTGLIPVDSAGMVTEPLLEQTLKKYNDARFAAIMAVNNETGSINDMASLRDTLRNKHGAPVHLHCDMVQAAGKIKIDIKGWDVDSASFSAHKIGGPRGIGLLYLRKPAQVLYSGGGQEHGIRPGTENVAGALALAGCLERRCAPEQIEQDSRNADKRCARLMSALKSVERCRIIPEDRKNNDKRFSPYIIQLGFKGIPGEVMTRALDDKGFAVSTGSACTSASPQRPLLAAMGIEDGLRLEGLRVSQGWSTTDKEIDQLIAAIMEALKFL